MNFILDLLVPFGPVLRRAENSKPFDFLTRAIFQALPLSFFIFWLFSFIPVVGGLVYFLAFVPLSARRHIQEHGIKEKQAKIKTHLWYLSVIALGFGGVWGFIGHTILADSVATQIGWATGSPFQIELAFYHLGFGIAGLLAIWFRERIIPGLVIAKSIFWYGAGFVHVYDAILHANYSPLNIGAPLVGDIILPTIFIVLLTKSYHKKKSARED